MIHEHIGISLNGQGPDADLSLYLAENSPETGAGRRRPMVIVCPGGGYGFLSFREEEPVALRLLALGYHAAVLRYSVAPERFPTQLLQALAAVACAREHADEWHVRADAVYLMGFSAGGHLAASAGVFWSRPHYAALLGKTTEAVRPNALVLAYPVITSGKYTHAGTMNNLLGEDDGLWRDTVSLEKQVTPDTPPCFLWHTGEDISVPMENSLMFSEALRRRGVPFELHVFEHGGHGLSLSTPEVFTEETADRMRPECACWLQMADRWLKLR